MTLPPEGWYADPNDSSRVRWWTGADWAERSRPADVSAPTPAGAPALKGRALRVERERRARKVNPFAWSGLLMGVFAVLFDPFAIPSVIAIVFASLGLARAQRLSDAGARFTGRGTAVAGLVVGIISLMLLGNRILSTYTS